MSFHYNLTRTERRSFAAAISRILEAPVAHYAASDTYMTDLCCVDKNGILSFAEDADPSEVERLVSRLRERGYIPLDKADGTVSYAVSIPIDELSSRVFRNLQLLIAHKEKLFKEAFGVGELPILLLKGRLWFPWFTLYGFENEVETYTNLVHAIYKLAQKPDSVVKQVCRAKIGWFNIFQFFLELGFTGKRHEAARKLLRENFASYTHL